MRSKLTENTLDHPQFAARARLLVELLWGYPDSVPDEAGGANLGGFGGFRYRSQTRPPVMLIF